MGKIFDYIKKYQSLISYLLFGICTTIINVVVFQIMYNTFNIGNVSANVIAWIVAVIFAYITNKLFVFDSKSFDLSVVLHEIITFTSCRLLTGVLDIAIMFVAVDIMKKEAAMCKIISNIIVIILNYVASKLVIFKKHE